MSFLYDNAAVLAVAVVASLMGWLFGGARADVLMPVVPWLFVLMVDIVLCFPQHHAGERAYEARSRVWHALQRSPLFWTVLGFLVLLQIPFVNNGLCPRCDAALIADGIKAAPPISFLPFCVNRLDHLNTVCWFAIALTSVVAVHHCLTRRGKRMVLELIVWNGAALAILGFVQNAMGAPGPLWCEPQGQASRVEFFSTFGYPNMAGDYFVLLFGVAVALWRNRCEQLRLAKEGLDASSRDALAKRGQFWKAHYFLLPAGLFFFAAINTLSRASILLVSSLAVVFFAHTLTVILSRMGRARRVTVGVWSVLAFSVLIFFATVSMPEKFRREVKSLGTTTVLNRVTGKAQYHTTVATSLWKEHRLFGCGGWGYAHFCGPQMQKLGIDTRIMQENGGANVHNDYLQFLAEHGLVGFGVLVAVVIFLLLPVVRQWRTMVREMRFAKPKDLPPKPVQIFVLPAPAFFLQLTALTTLIHAFGDCPLRSCAVLTLFYVILAAIPGFMPKHGVDAAAPEVKSEHHHHHRHHHHRGLFHRH